MRSFSGERLPKIIAQIQEIWRGRRVYFLYSDIVYKSQDTQLTIKCSKTTCLLHLSAAFQRLHYADDYFHIRSDRTLFK